MSTTGDSAMKSSRTEYEKHCDGNTRPDQSIPVTTRSAYVQSVYSGGSLAL